MCLTRGEQQRSWCESLCWNLSDEHYTWTFHLACKDKVNRCVVIIRQFTCVQSLMVAKAKEELEQEILVKEEEKEKYLAERAPPLNTSGLSLAQLQVTGPSISRIPSCPLSSFDWFLSNLKSVKAATEATSFIHTLGKCYWSFHEMSHIQQRFSEHKGPVHLKINNMTSFAPVLFIHLGC